PRVLLTEFFVNTSSKMEVIVTFMAILELIRLREIKVMQKRLFSDIEVFRNLEKEAAVTPPDRDNPAGSSPESSPDPEPAA
ncbi:MAG TPA: segregation/condensation protein A, partial [Candidatus Omnitrophota bacterium]|nr:segregation/condensation protein A [Candidatus Omnitrophota bacterium]